MQYSPKLKKATEEIKGILKKYDIAAFVALHTPGFGEFLLEIGPSYSCAKFNGDELRVRSRIKEDYNGDKKKRDQDLTDTTNMLSLLAQMTGDFAVNLQQISKMVDKQVDATHTGDDTSSHTQQNN